VLATVCALWGVFTVPALAAEHGDAAEKQAEEEREGGESGYRNVVAIKGAYSRHFNRSRSNPGASDEAPAADDMGGFIISYERVFVPNWFAIELAKPFFFGKGRFDSPLDLMFKVFHDMKGVEPYFSLGATLNVRLFDKEREEVEGIGNEASLGLVAAGGVAFWITHRIGIEVEIEYAYIPGQSIVAHEFTPSAGVAFAY